MHLHITKSSFSPQLSISINFIWVHNIASWITKEPFMAHILDTWDMDYQKYLVILLVWSQLQHSFSWNLCCNLRGIALCYNKLISNYPFSIIISAYHFLLCWYRNQIDQSLVIFIITHFYQVSSTTLLRSWMTHHSRICLIIPIYQ